MKIHDQHITGPVRLTLLLAFLYAVTAQGASFVEPGSMGSGRFRGTATLLPNGKVLLAGGLARSRENPIFQEVASAEIYDPSTRVWSFVGSMSVARVAHAAVILSD